MSTIEAFPISIASVYIVALVSLSGPTRAAFQYPVQVTAYGALCNGIHEDTTNIASAITAAGAGGTVQFPAGVCVIDTLSTSPSIYLNDVALVGAEVARFSDSTTSATEAGTFISIGTSSVPQYTNNTTLLNGVVPFYLKNSVTIRGINFIYPYVICQSQPIGCPQTPPLPPLFPLQVLSPLFADDGIDEVSNILFENVHVIAAYNFWVQGGGGGTTVTYGNIRFDNTDVYALNAVFTWANVQQTVTFSNFISSPSLCSGNYSNVQCSEALEAWTGDNGYWLHVVGGTIGSGMKLQQTDVGGLLATNLSVTGYKIGVLVDSSGHLDESIFGSSTVFDTVL